MNVINYKNTYDEKIILVYKGVLSFDLVSNIIETLEKKLDEIDEDRQLKKKFHNVATECIQNLHYHIGDIEYIKNINEEVLSDQLKKTVIILATVRSKYYNLLTVNYISNDSLEKIKKKIDLINSLDEKSLRILYKQSMDQDFSEKGTAGLGYIDIARKTNQKLRYQFDELNPDVFLFTFQIRILKNNINTVNL
ncbi:MAG: SiaB family protein kinase [Chitinophagaceae bacterium]|nr:SiaB family protein kinase [Chitinophagaceae bacterium]